MESLRKSIDETSVTTTSGTTSITKMSDSDEKVLNNTTSVFRFYNPFSCFNEEKNHWCDMTIVCKEVQFSDGKIYYEMTYGYKYSDEEGEYSNPFDKDELPCGDYIFKNPMTEIMVSYIMMPFEELEQYSGGIISVQQYKTDLLNASHHLWD